MTEKPAQNRARLRRRISFAVAIVLTGVIAGVLYRQSELLPRRISTYVNEHYLKGTSFEFSVDGISGFLIREVKLTNPTLRYHSQTASYNVFRADEISIEYDLMPVFAFRLIVTDLKLRNVAIHLRQDDEGKLVLPVLPGGGKEGGKLDVSPVVNVRRFEVDGLAVQFGGNQRQLAVRDVHLSGALEYSEGSGHVIVDDGRAYLIESQKTISSIRLDAKTDRDSVKISDFALRLKESFVMARGTFRDGRFDQFNVVVNPISISELHELGLIGDKQGVFSGQVDISGAVDSLGVDGEVSGNGLGVELSGVKFSGSVTPDRLLLASMQGEVFGTRVNGRFDLDIHSEDFVYDGQVEDLDLGRGFITDTELPPMSLTGRVWVRRTKAIDRFDWQGDLSRGVVDGFECFDVRGKGVFTEAEGLVIERASLVRPGFRAQGNGTVDTQDVVDLVFKIDATDLSYFWNHFKLPNVGGATSLNGWLHGPIDDFTVNLNGPFENLVFEPTTLDRGTVIAEARNIGTLAPEVSVALESEHGSLSGVWFERPQVSLEIDTSHVEIRNAHFERGDTSFVVDLDVKAKGEKARIDVRHVTVTTPTDEWVNADQSAMYVEPGVLKVDSLTMVCARGSLGGAGMIYPDAHTLDFSAWGRNIDLGVARDVAKLPFRLSGRGDFALSLSGPADDPLGKIDVNIVRGVVDSVAFDRLTGRAEYTGRRYRVEHLEVVAGRDTMRAQGSWTSDVSPVRIARGERTDSLWTAPLKGRVSFAHYPLATVFRAMHKPTLVAAAFDGTVDIGGSLEKPVLHARGAIVPAPGEGRELPPADIDVTYRDGALRVDRLNTREELNVSLTGSFPLLLSAHDGARVDTDGPLQFKLDIKPDGDKPVEIGRYITGVSLLRGLVSGTVTGAGTPGAPRLSGGLNLTNARLRVIGLEEAFNDLSIRIEFLDDVVRITQLTARSGEKGTLSARGWTRISNYRPADYKIDVTLKEFAVNSIEDVEVRTDGNLSLRLIPWRDGRRIPQITGALAVREATITMDVMQASTGGPTATSAEFTRPTDSPNWLASVDLNADKNVWIRNPDLIVELEGDVTLIRDERGLYFRGDMGILRGSYNVFGNKFEITDGAFDFSASETLRPSMQINAYTPYHTTDPNDVGGDIYLALSWPYDQREPRIKLSYPSRPGYTEAELWSMLGRNNLGAGMATNALERVIDSQMTGGFDVQVGQRSVQDPYNPARTQQETTVGVGRYWQDFYLQYRRGLSVGSEQEVSVEYRLGRRFWIRSQMIYNSRRQSGAIQGQTTDEYNVDVKYRFEF